MTIVKTVLSTSLILAMGVSSSLFALTEGEPATAEAPVAAIVDGDAVVIECIPQAEVDAMTEEDKGELKLPVCDEMMNEKNAEEPEKEAPQ